MSLNSPTWGADHATPCLSKYNVTQTKGIARLLITTLNEKGRNDSSCGNLPSVRSTQDILPRSTLSYKYGHFSGSQKKQDVKTCGLMKVVKKNKNCSWPLEISACPAPLCWPVSLYCSPNRRAPLWVTGWGRRGNMDTCLVAPGVII